MIKLADLLERRSKIVDWMKAAHTAENNDEFKTAETELRAIGPQMSASTSANAGGLIADEHRTDQYINALAAASVVRRMGATGLTGFVGNISILRETGAPTVGWVANCSAQPKPFAHARHHERRVLTEAARVISNAPQKRIQETEIRETKILGTMMLETIARFVGRTITGQRNAMLCKGALT